MIKKLFTQNYQFRFFYNQNDFDLTKIYAFFRPRQDIAKHTRRSYFFGNKKKRNLPVREIRDQKKGYVFS